MHRWADEIEKDFSKWLNDHINKLPVPKEQIQEIIKQREATQQTNTTSVKFESQ